MGKLTVCKDCGNYRDLGLCSGERPARIWLAVEGRIQVCLWSTKEVRKINTDGHCPYFKPKGEHLTELEIMDEFFKGFPGWYQESFALECTHWTDECVLVPALYAWIVFKRKEYLEANHETNSQG